MKKKIPKWLGKVGAIIGIIAVIVSSMILPASAGMSTNAVVFDTYTQEYSISSIQMYLFECDNPDRYRDLKNCFISFTPSGVFPINSSSSGTYVRYDPCCFKAPGSTIYYPATGLLQTSGPALTYTVGDHTRFIRDVRNFFIFSTDGNGLASTSFSTDSIDIMFDDIYIPAGRYDFAKYPTDNGIFPAIYLNSFVSYGENINVRYSFKYEYLDYDSGELKVSDRAFNRSFSMVENSSGLWGVDDTNSNKRRIPIFDYNMFLGTAAYYTDLKSKDPSHSAYHFFDYNISIEAADDTKFSVVGIQYNMPYILGEDNQDIFYEDYKNAVVIRDNTSDMNLSSWLTNAIGGFLNFEIFPGLSISSVLAVVVSITLMLSVLKYFAGG